MRAILISSHRSNTVARMHLLDSLLPQASAAGVGVLVVIGGCPADGPLTAQTIGDGTRYSCIECQHNSFDLTALLEVMKRRGVCGWTRFFLLHDTCRAGPDCVRRILEACPADPLHTASFKFPSMNIGWYSEDILKTHTAWLLDQACTDTTQSQKFKRDAVISEDLIFKTQVHAGRHHFLGKITSLQQPVDYYGTGVKRIVEYYACLDLYKIKANWVVKPVYELGM